MSDLTDGQAVVTESHVGTEAGKFEVALADAERALSNLELKPPINLTFLWHGMHFTVRVKRVDQYFRLRLTGDIAVLPYSAENTIARSNLLRLADSASDCDANRFFRLAAAARHLPRRDNPFRATKPCHRHRSDGNNGVGGQTSTRQCHGRKRRAARLGQARTRRRQPDASQFRTGRMKICPGKIKSGSPIWLALAVKIKVYLNPLPYVERAIRHRLFPGCTTTWPPALG